MALVEFDVPLDFRQQAGLFALGPVEFNQQAWPRAASSEAEMHKPLDEKSRITIEFVPPNGHLAFAFTT